MKKPMKSKGYRSGGKVKKMSKGGAAGGKKVMGMSKGGSPAMTLAQVKSAAKALGKKVV